ncbi:V-ATPase subunit H [Nitzschia inconspicua]|uniref:V-ATPase subunit H n=1 Tax=Nitzschia inconspicua TaxID=303405 RepID=A0A9K3PAD9_9STRA|nr:V-ATPase subunit H [Nitzschia inconspicua]KAG7358680.1 V-ATPase subunit H [Nitzschia inconspicua]
MFPIHHPVLSLSPLQEAFPHIPWMLGDADHSYSYYSDDNENNNRQQLGGVITTSAIPLLLSKPELLLLRSAEENPLEYTLADYDDAFLYVRMLLKLLDQVTSTQSNSDGMLVSAACLGRLDCSSHRPLSEEDALEVYSHDRIGVVTHYIVTRLYELLGALIERQHAQPHRPSSSSRNTLRTEISTLTLFYHRQPYSNQYVLMDDWRPLLRLLYRSDRDDFSKRGAALVLAYILIAGLEQQQQGRESTNAALLVPPLESIQDNNNSNNNNNEMVQETLQSLVSWLTSRLQSSHITSLGSVTPTLMVLATVPQARKALDEAGGIGYLCRHIKSFHRNHQRHKQIINRRHKEYQRQSSIPKVRHSVLEANNGGEKENNNSSEFLETALSVVSSSLSQVPRQFKDAVVISPTSPRRSANVGNSIHSRRSSPGTASESGTYLTEASATLVSQVASMLSSPASLVGGSSQGAPRLSPPTSANGLQEPLSSIGTEFGSSPIKNRGSPSSLSTSSPSSSVQQLYELVFTLWCIVLDCPERQDVRQHMVRDGVVSTLAQLLRTAPREKILRLTVASLRILASLDDSEGMKQHHSVVKTSSLVAPIGSGDDMVRINSPIFIQEMIASDIQKPLDLLRQRRWNDPDLQEDIDMLYDTVQTHTRELTQWKTYQAELEAGVLRWSSHLHNSKFFRENVRSMEGPRGDFAPLQRLVEILYRHTQSGRLKNTSGSKTMYVGLKEVIVPRNGVALLDQEFSWDQDDINDDELCECLAVALYDIGEFARHYPNGRGVISAASRLQWTHPDSQQSMLGKTKSVVMQYMHHPRENVQLQALSCFSKLLIHNWNAVTTSGS